MYALRQARRSDPELCHLHLAGGSSPARGPPSEGALARARQRLAAVVGVPAADAEATHPATPWIYHLFRAVLGKVSDPDVALARWLETGAPMGIGNAD